MSEIRDPGASTPYTVDNYSQDESIGFLTHQVKMRISQAIDERIHEFGITTAQWAVLKQIAMHNGETATALCKCTGCDTGSMTRMLDRLEEKDLIRRERSTTDRRVVQLQVTENGQALLPDLVPRVVEALNLALKDFSDTEVSQLKHLLRRILDNLERRGD